MAPLSVVNFLHGGMPLAGVVVVVDSSAINNVEGGGLLAISQVDEEEDLIDSLCTWNLTL